MTRLEIMEKLLTYYKECGVTEEQIAEMVDTGIDEGIRPEIVLYNIFNQLTEEYVHDMSIDPFRKTAEIFGITPDELSALVI